MLYRRKRQKIFCGESFPQWKLLFYHLSQGLHKTCIRELHIRYRKGVSLWFMNQSLIYIRNWIRDWSLLTSTGMFSLTSVGLVLCMKRRKGRTVCGEGKRVRMTTPPESLTGMPTKLGKLVCHQFKQACQLILCSWKKRKDNRRKRGTRTSFFFNLYYPTLLNVAGYYNWEVDHCNLPVGMPLNLTPGCRAHCPCLLALQLVRQPQSSQSSIMLQNSWKSRIHHCQDISKSLQTLGCAWIRWASQRWHLCWEISQYWAEEGSLSLL